MIKIPPFVHIETTINCNLSCEMCGNTAMRRKHQNISIELVQEAADQIKIWKKKPTILFHTVGEPTLHPQIEEIVTIFLSQSIPINFYTNGTIPNVELFTHILKDHNNCITFSVGSYHSNNFPQRLKAIQ